MLETAVETEKQAVKDEKKFNKSELELNKVHIQIGKNQILKKCRAEIKEEKSLNFKNLFVDNNDIFDNEENSNAETEFIIDLIDRKNFVADVLPMLQNQMCHKWKLFILRGKKLRRTNKCRLMMTKREKMQALKTV